MPVWHGLLCSHDGASAVSIRQTSPTSRAGAWNVPVRHRLLCIYDSVSAVPTRWHSHNSRAQGAPPQESKALCTQNESDVSTLLKAQSSQMPDVIIKERKGTSIVTTVLRVNLKPEFGSQHLSSLKDGQSARVLQLSNARNLHRLNKMQEIRSEMIQAPMSMM